jgi:hypothetical protein
MASSTQGELSDAEHSSQLRKAVVAATVGTLAPARDLDVCKSSKK